jgi:hypothetical protein
VVLPQPASTAATIRAPAALNQRLLFFKIPYLGELRRDWWRAGAVNKFDGDEETPSGSPARSPFQRRFQLCF